MDISVINFTLEPVSGLASVIYWLIGLSSSIAVGVILFTLILKLITFPFDLYSKISMRKNSLKMEEMRPELEKLQKQYANDKVLYNQKMMALYKQNGYSMWGACLPTIITLVIFIVAINAFTSYSQYQNKKYFYDMSLAYNTAIYDGFTANNDAFIKIDSGNFSINNDEFVAELGEVGIEVNFSKDEKINLKKTNDGYILTTDGGYTGCKVFLNDQNKVSSRSFFIIEENLPEEYFTLKASNEQLTPVTYVESLGSKKSAESFRNNTSSLLWIKNIFIADSAFKHPIYENAEEFKKEYSYKSGENDFNSNYAKLIANLDEEKTQPNGYFILVALTIISSLLMQFITTKSQKAQMELQTVDGQGAQTQKIMMWMMPIMMGFFAFMYTAAFSIYIILSSLISLITQVGTNFFLNRKFKNIKSVKESKPIRGRVYTPKEEEVKKQKKKENSKNKIEEHDFLSGLADKKKRKHK